jgi:hypothetical protein
MSGKTDVWYVGLGALYAYQFTTLFESETSGSQMSVTVSPTTLRADVGQQQTFSSAVTGGNAPYSYQWYLNGNSVSGATGSTWTFAPSTAGSFNVYVSVTDNDGTDAQSNIVTDITVYAAPSISISPTPVNLSVNSTQQFTSSVTGGSTPYTYRWYYTNGTAITGATASTLTYKANSTGTNNIYLNVTDSLSYRAQSNTATINAYSQPSVIINPTSVNMLVGNTQNFTSTTTGGLIPYTYQWYLNDTAQSGATANTWNFTTATAGHYKVYLNVTDTLNSKVQSNIVTNITVYTQSGVTISPSSVNMTIGGSQTFSSTVTGGTAPYSYQWYQNSTPVTGANSANWIFTPASVGSYNIYLNVTDNNAVTVKSNIASAKVEPIIPSFALTVMASGNGITNNTGTTTYSQNTNVITLATPNLGYQLTYWLLNGTNFGSANPYVLNMTANYNLTAVFGQSNLVLLSGWTADSSLTNAPYVLNSSPSSLSLELDATGTNSKVAIYNPSVSKLSLSNYGSVKVAVTGTSNALILLRFFMDNGNSFDVAYWISPSALNAVNFDLSPYTGRTLTGTVYVALMSTDGSKASINITQITFVPPAPLSSTVPLNGWATDPSITNAPYVLNSNPSDLSLELDATNTNSKVAIYTQGVSKLNLSNYAYVNITATGTTNAKVLLRFFMDNGNSFDVAYWLSPSSLNAVRFDLSPYAGRTLTGLVYIALMSTDGTTANINITQIAFAPPTPSSPLVPLDGWTADSSLTNASYILTSSQSNLSLELDATGTNSKVAIYTMTASKLNLSNYGSVKVSITGTNNALVLIRFFQDNGNSFDVAYWINPTTLNSVSFDLSPYTGRTLTGQVYIALMSSNGSNASINITQIAFIPPVAPSPLVPLSGWTVDSGLTNAQYVLNSTQSNLSLQLNATDTSSKAAIYTSGVSKLSLSSYAYVNVTITGTANARILLRFFLDNGTSFDVIYWGTPTQLNSIQFNLTPYAGRTLTGLVYIALMSSNGTQANISITQIALVT